MGTLYYGDNLDILRRYLPDGSVDLVYLDPPFNSAQTYNAFFQEKDGTAAASQIKAFEDTWEWNLESASVYQALTEQPGKVSEVMQAFRTFLGTNDMMAYLAMMAPRLVELRRVLKPTGSLYLHCDPTASHYLKLLLDGVFGGACFRNEIIWRRTRAHNDRKIRRYGSVHDSILFYSRREQDWLFNVQFKERDENAPKTHDLYQHTDGIIYRKDNCRAPGGRGPRYDWNGHTENWRFSPEEKERLIEEGRIVYSKSGMPRVLRPVDLTKGSPLQDAWTDIDPLNSGSAEILGYPTQKPVALLERIVAASSNPGDVVLDPFCGCGTTIDAAEKLGRRWIGIDITSLSTALIKARLRDTYGDKIEIRTVGEPVSLPDAEALAAQDKYQFQWWALGLVGARPVEEKKGADKGIDGKILFRERSDAPKPTQIILSVKGGGVSVPAVRDLRGVIEREGAAIGVLISLYPPTGPMMVEAASAGFYESAYWGKYPRLQLLTVGQLLAGKTIERPPTLALDATFKRAPKAAGPAAPAHPELEL